MDGILFALKKDQGAIELENDNLGVMQMITGVNHSRLRTPFSRAAFGYIYELVTPLEWFAARWIPRGRNQADRLFHIKPEGQTAPQ